MTKHEFGKRRIKVKYTKKKLLRTCSSSSLGVRAGPVCCHPSRFRTLRPREGLSPPGAPPPSSSPNNGLVLIVKIIKKKGGGNRDLDFIKENNGHLYGKRI